MCICNTGDLRHDETNVEMPVSSGYTQLRVRGESWQIKSCCVIQLTQATSRNIHLTVDRAISHDCVFIDSTSNYLVTAETALLMVGFAQMMSHRQPAKSLTFPVPTNWGILATQRLQAWIDHAASLLSQAAPGLGCAYGFARQTAKGAIS
jgi:hypothetical protein